MIYLLVPQNRARCSCQQHKQSLMIALWFALLSCEIPAALPRPDPRGSPTYRAIEEPVGVHGQVLPRLGAPDVHHPHALCTQLQLNWEGKIKQQQ